MYIFTIKLVYSLLLGTGYFMNKKSQSEIRSNEMPS